MSTQIAKPTTATQAAIHLLDAQRALVESIVPTTVRGQFEWDAIRTDVMLAVQGSKQLQECDPKSILASVLYIVRLGLPIGGFEGKAYLVPYKKACTPIIGAQGKIELAYRSGKISKLNVQIVYARDRFDADLANGTVTHRLPETDVGDRGDPMICYALGWVKGSPDPVFEVMDRKQINAIRSKSPAADSPAWRDHFTEMWRRSCLNRLLKRLPKSKDLWEVIGSEDLVDRGAAVTLTPASRLLIDPTTIPQLTDDGASGEEIDARAAEAVGIEPEPVEPKPEPKPPTSGPRQGPRKPAAEPAPAAASDDDDGAP